jgi:transcriptional regulator with GAF, ATPase, and Fis domain
MRRFRPSGATATRRNNGTVHVDLHMAPLAAVQVGHTKGGVQIAAETTPAGGRLAQHVAKRCVVRHRCRPEAQMAFGAHPSGYNSQELGYFDELLAALARGLEVREFFQRLTAVASHIVPHDEAHLLVLAEDGAEWVYASTPDGLPEQIADQTAATILDVSEPRVLDVVPGADRGLQSGMKVPVRIEDRVVGAFAVFSRRPQAYSADDLVHAERLARYLALGLTHQRLTKEAREATVERQRSANIDGSIELLRTISDVLDIRTVFPRVSDIARKMLPHDALAMVFVDQDRHFVRQAAWPDDFPDPPSIAAKTSMPKELIIADLSTGPLPVFEPADAFTPVIAAGYRSFLGVRIPARERVVELAFWARRSGAFTPPDLLVARRIADHIALAVSHEQLAEAARRAAEARTRAEQLETRVQILAQELESKTQIRVVGESAEWRDVLTKATQVAETDTTVLVTGESGSGKEVVARFIHRASARSRGPFVALNCAALPEQLLESELFGYERGAFTSAQQAKPGLIELAAGGVLFLDEVTEMSLPAQAKFLRVLQEREFQRLGATRILKANIRVIAATNGDLRKAVERGDFREDLFYRLQVFDISIPPLRERRTDILPLSEALLQDLSKSFARPPAGLTRDAREALLRYDWPGNVRELRNALERAAILCQGRPIDTEHLALHAIGQPRGAVSTDLSTIERDTIAPILRECRWNIAKAARRLGLTRSQLYGRMKKYGLEKPPD